MKTIMKVDKESERRIAYLRHKSFYKKRSSLNLQMTANNQEIDAYKYRLEVERRYLDKHPEELRKLREAIRTLKMRNRSHVASLKRLDEAGQ
jgi:hypothetical protein